MLTTNDIRRAAEFLSRAPDGTYRVLPGGVLVVLRDDGFQAGRPDITEPLTGSRTPGRIYKWLTGARPGRLSVLEAGCDVGIWTDGTGLRFTEASTHYLSLERALEIATELGERCVWDWAAGTTIPTEEN